jgi:hypothetical protein
LKKFAGNVSDAAMGIGRAKIVFEKLGISATDASGKMRPVSAVMDDLKEKMQGLGRAQQLRIMEKLGLDPKLLKLFNDEFGQTTKIKEQLDAIDLAAGFNLDKSIAQSNEFEKSWAGLRTEVGLFKMLFEKMHEAVAVRMMPGIEIGIERITKAIERARHFFMDNALQIENALQPILETIVTIGSAVAQLTGRAFQLMGELISPVVKLLVDANKYTHGWIFKIGALIVAWKAFNLSFLMSPLGLIIALGAALLLLYDDFKGWQEGKKSAIDWGSGTGTAIKGIVAALGGLVAIFAVAKTSMMTMTALTKAYAVVSKVAAVATMLFNAVLSANPIGLVIIAITALIGAGYLLIKNWDSVKKWFHEFFGWFEKKGEMVSDIASKISNGFGHSMHILEGKILGSGAGGGNVALHQNTTVHVNGAQSPHAVAVAVAAQQNTVNAQITRNMTARAR